MEQSLSIYKASAGSGKTFTLAVEYIMGLLLPHAEKEFEHILAVTFTNKATAEMKGRIRRSKDSHHKATSQRTGRACPYSHPA